VAQRGFSVGYESAPHLLEKLQKAKFSDDPQDAKNAAFLAECDLLVIDDLGTEMVNQSTRSNLYVLVNDRLQGEKPTIISSNLRMQEFEQRYGRQVASRLLYAYTHYPFIGTDLRKGKI
jgi:DNA replication protein DnaC